MANKLSASKTETSKGRVKLGKLEKRTKALNSKQAKNVRGGLGGTKKSSGPGGTTTPK
jgi:hypothetical protein